MFKTPKMLQVLLGPSGGSLRCVGCILKSFKHFYSSYLAYGREQKCIKRVLEHIRLLHYQHVKINNNDSTMFKPLDNIT